MWTVTGNRVNLDELAPKDEIETRARELADAVRNRRDVGPPAAALSQVLFGKLRNYVWQKSEWLITGDGALLSETPFSTLQDISSLRKEPLIANHTIRSLPTELLLLQPNAPLENRFVGVADPIYNLADSRRHRNMTLVEASSTEPTVPLGRLVGSDQEIRTAAKQSGMPDTQLLLGAASTGQELRNALAKPPGVLHFAVHVVSPAGQPEQAALALSLTKENIPELLTPEGIAALHVPGCLVVLSGCSSGQGRPVPSAGIIGLSRAWLLAGAAAVVVSAWPTVDDSGRFFSVFYSHLQRLKAGSIGARAAAALQQTQLEMQRANGYRSSPSFWAAYSIVSKE